MTAEYNYIGTRYNETRCADAYLTTRLRVLLDPKPEGHYLDIGCGTGNYTVAMASQGGTFTALDPSEKMLAEARQKSDKIHWKLGSAETIGLASNSMDGALATLTIHHWSDLEQGFLEVARVLKPGAHLVLFTSLPDQMAGYWLNHYFPHMLQESMLQMPSMHRIEAAATSSGMQIELTEKYFVKPTIEDHFLYCGKDRPNLYLDPNVRRGISSFSSLANQAEVTAGLRQLKSDIDSGRIDDVIEQYRNEKGDYIFLRMRA